MLCLPTEFPKKYSARHGINLCWKASYTPSPRKHNRTCAREISLAKHTSWNIHEGFVSHTKKEKERAMRERERDIYIFAEKRRRRRAGRFARRQTSRRRHKIGARSCPLGGYVCETCSHVLATFIVAFWDRTRLCATAGLTRASASLISSYFKERDRARSLSLITASHRSRSYIFSVAARELRRYKSRQLSRHLQSRTTFFLYTCHFLVGFRTSRKWKSGK